ncbi:hypothetical protein [Hyphomicrobium facile]|uniref:Tissue inhibitor of metalloproteinase n=1 Tax=Hyphomicrobium facile TaxID=51670 RepID=A0A1I7NHI4_9HYPH|nr:hypothetical protein [Hyphomicrobium facile]SFV34074.1 hypothetical protein SAMN04488557_2205 [Hyphomicrobium facile]
MQWTNVWRASCLLAVTTACAFGAARADDPVRVSGYFCGAKKDQIAFLQREAAGDTGEIAANTVNKAAGKQTCAFFLPAQAIAMNDQTVISDGIVYKVQSFVFLPEKVERWTGTHFGSMRSTKPVREL